MFSVIMLSLLCVRVKIVPVIRENIVLIFTFFPRYQRNFQIKTGFRFKQVLSILKNLKYFTRKMNSHSVRLMGYESRVWQV